MSLENLAVIDLIVLSLDKKKVSLVVYDGGEIPVPAEREQALQKKLRTYLEFVASGRFLNDYPEHADRGVCALVVCLNPPTEGMNAIEGIRDHDRPETFLSVEITTDAEFRASFPKKKSQELKRVATFSKSDEAYLLRAHLEGSGISVFVRDEHTVSADWGLSNAVGGVKVEVLEEDYAAAVELLAAFSVPAPASKGKSDHTMARYVRIFFFVWLALYTATCIALAIQAPPEPFAFWFFMLLPCGIFAGLITFILAIFDL
jgi:hypothetical protein